MRPQAAFGHDKMQAFCRDTHLLAFYPIFLIFSASKRLRTRINKGIFIIRIYVSKRKWWAAWDFRIRMKEFTVLPHRFL